MYYALTFLAVLGLAFQFCNNKVYQKHFGASPFSSLVYVGLSSLAVSAMLFAVNGFKLQLTPFSTALALTISVISTTNAVIGFKVMSLGKMSIYTMFLMLGGMLLPYVFGLLFLNEQLTFGCGVGLVLLLIALYLTATDKDDRLKNANKIFIILCILVFTLNGFVSIFSKMHQVEQIHPTAGIFDFVCIGNLANSILATIACIFFHFKDSKKEAAPSTGSKNYLLFFILTMLNAIIGCGSYLLQLVGASHLPATILYPIITGGSVVLTTIAGYLFFKEKITPRIALGTIIAFIATVLFMF